MANNKRRKLSESRDLLYLPNELFINHIFNNLNTKDIINLSMSNKSFRKHFCPFIFNHIYIPWSKLSLFIKEFNLQEDDCDKDDGDDLLLSTNKLISFVTKLSIISSDKSSEWESFNQLDLIILELFKIEHLSLNLSSSTFCLKYFRFKSYLKQIHIKTDKLNSNFNLNHLIKFNEIDLLILENFNFESFNNKQFKKQSEFLKINTNNHFDEDDNDQKIPMINNLKLINCSWNYPFQLSEFNENSLKSLNLKYSNNNKFLLSERLQFFFDNPNLNLNLDSLMINLNQNNDSIIKFINLENHLNFKKLVFIKKIQLIGIPFRDIDFLIKLNNEINNVNDYKLEELTICYYPNLFNSDKEKLNLERKTLLEGKKFKFKVTII